MSKNYLNEEVAVEPVTLMCARGLKTLKLSPTLSLKLAQNKGKFSKTQKDPRIVLYDGWAKGFS